MAKRLNKITREFNVGIATIVEFLEEKGHAIDSNPNTKVPDELYEMLVEEFSSDIKVKKESNNINLADARKKKETISLPDVEESAPKEQEEEIEQKESVAVKVVGKIDLNAKSPKKAQEEQTPDVPETKEEEPEVIKEEPVQDISDKEEPSQEPETDPVPEIEVSDESEQDTSEDNSETPEEKSEEPQKVFGDKPEIENNVKVIGKIDLSSLNQKTRPDRKSKEEKDKERKQRLEAKKRTQDGNKKQNSSNDNVSGNEGSDKVFKAGVTKLSGPTVVGKIDLPSKSDDQQDDNNKKRKRKRIKKEKVSISDPKSQAQSNRNNSNTNNKKNKKQKRKPHTQKEDIKDEDIQKQIKDTLSRLTNKGKSKASKHRRDKRDAVNQRLQEEAEAEMLEKNKIKVTEFISVNDIASMMNVPVTDIISSCMSLGLFVSINQRLDAETIALIAEEFNHEVEFVSVEIQEAIEQVEDKDEDLSTRPPIVTVMGHVDHGKTSLLDHIRNENVIAGEAGGITQHIGAYGVQLKSGQKITFLDTPGHEAFTAMRARGAQVTDIAIIVIAADDNVMPQTIEAINHASAAGVPIVFAINKVDKDGANPDKIREELANMNYLVEEWGGKYQCQEISAKFGKRVDELLDKVILEAELLELKANPEKPALGTIIESELDKGRGYVSTILVEAGTLKVGDIMLAGQYTGRVKAMFNERNQIVEKAGPAEPVIILGLNGAPQAGDKFNVMTSDREAKEIANKREQLQREQELKTKKHVTLDEIGRRIAIGNFQELNVIVKGDVDGSIEALSDSLIKLSTEEIQVNVIHKAVGQVTESDVMLASASDAIIIGFQVRPSAGARKVAENEGIDIRLYSIIYDAINELKDAMAGMLSPEIKEEITGTAEIQEVFKISKVGTIAGCLVQDGKIFRNSKVRVIRDGIVVYTGELGSLKRFKDDVKEVARGYECGLNVQNFNDIKVGDLVEAFEMKEYQRKL